MSEMGDGPLSTVGKRVRRGRSSDSSAVVTDTAGIDLAVQVPGLLAAGIEQFGKGMNGLAAKAGIGGDRLQLPSIEGALGITGEGVSRAAAALGDLASGALTNAVEGLGHVAAVAGPLATTTGELLAGAAGASGEIASTVAAAVGAVAEAGADAAGEIIGGLANLP